jgi:putative methionine-R-sulfoxide reductase with GAF domain
MVDSRTVLRSLHSELAGTMDATMCWFGRYDPAEQSVEVLWQIHDGVELPGGRFPLGSGPSSEAIRTQTPRLVRHCSKTGPSVRIQYATDRPGLPESMMFVPIVLSGKVVGVVSVQSYEPEAYDAAHLALLTQLAPRAAPALSAEFPKPGLLLFQEKNSLSREKLTAAKPA